MYCWKTFWRLLERRWRSRIVRCMDRFHTIYYLLKERPPDGFTLSGERPTRKQTTSRPDNVWPDLWKHMSDASKRKAKQKWAIEKPKLDNARKSRGIFFIEPNDEQFKHTMKAARRKLEIPMPAAMPFKIPIQNSGETHRNIGKTRRNMLVLSMPANLWEYDWKVCRTGITKITSLQKE